jgi:hypothetical protein
MVNNHTALIREFKEAVNRIQNNPKELARLLDVPPVQPNTNQATPKRSARDVQLVAIDGTDWSSVLSSWLEVISTANSVGCAVGLVGPSISFCTLLSPGRRNTML